MEASDRADDRDTALTARTSRDRTLRLAWGGLGLIALALLVQPVSYGIMRLASLLSLAGIWAGALYFGWRWRPVRAALAIVALLPLLLLLPGRPVDQRALRAIYLKKLRSYEGVRYHWGGETSLGIDCSGLVRRGLIHASAREGLRTANPALLRDAIALWWYDASAKALRDQYRGFTTRVGPAKSTNDIAPDKIHPGDLIVTQDGKHTMAYLGDRTWIEADPDAGRVLVVQTPTTNGWFRLPVEIVRWRHLTPDGRSEVTHAPR